MSKHHGQKKVLQVKNRVREADSSLKEQEIYWDGKSKGVGSIQLVMDLDTVKLRAYRNYEENGGFPMS